MTVHHHPSDLVLLDHAAGRLARGPAMLINVHLSVCPACRAAAAGFEALGGALLEDLPPSQMAPDALDLALARIERPAPDAPPPRPISTPAGIDLTEALHGLPLGGRRWLAPGIWMRPVLREGRSVTYLLRSGPGKRLPRHSHLGEEYVCVVKGAFFDETGHYAAGDFAQSDDELTHSPQTDPDGECICLISAEGPMRMFEPIARALQPLFGL